MRLIFILTLAAASVCFAGCARQETQPNSNSPTATAPTKPAGEMSPTEVFAAYTEAARRKDLTELEKHLSQGTLKYIAQTAQSDQVTVDEILSGVADDVSQTESETRSEIIEGESATVEFKNAVTGGWDKLPFVKEDGRWKIALDKILEEILKNPEKIEINKQGGETIK